MIMVRMLVKSKCKNILKKIKPGYPKESKFLVSAQGISLEKEEDLSPWIALGHILLLEQNEETIMQECLVCSRPWQEKETLITAPSTSVKLRRNTTHLFNEP